MFRIRLFLRAATLSAALMLGACYASTETPDPGDGSVEITPSSITLNVGQTQRITATVRDVGGSVVEGVVIDWSSSSNGVATVDSEGLVTAVGEGTATITGSSMGLSAEVPVTVEAALPVARVQVSPSRATIGVGAALQLQVTVWDTENEEVVGRQVAWSTGDAAVATVDGAGRVVGQAEGSAQINAASGGVSDAADITVALATSNEPVGFTTITDRAFNALATCRDGNSRIDGWDDVEACSGRFSIVQDQDAPISPSSVLQVYYPEGFVAGSAPGTGQRFWSESLGYRKMYVRFPLKLSADFHGHRSTTNKVQHIWLGSAGGNRVFTRVVGADANPLEFQIALQGVPDDRTRLRPNQEVSGIIDRGTWYTIEMVFELNTPGVANGVARAWLNGQLFIEYTDVLYQTSSENFVFTQLQISPTWGGGDDIAPNDFELWIDHTYISAMP